MKSILDKDFKYVHSSKTNVSKTFDRIRKEQKEAAKKASEVQVAKEAQPINIFFNKKIYKG